MRIEERRKAQSAERRASGEKGKKELTMELHGKSLILQPRRTRRKGKALT
jgi:hypothetical protein